MTLSVWVRKALTDLITAGSAAAAGIAILVNAASTVHIPSADVAILVAVAGFLNVGINAIRRFINSQPTPVAPPAK
jgi:hypothetical protein